jgi:hypothetical protein
MLLLKRSGRVDGFVECLLGHGWCRKHVSSMYRNYLMRYDSCCILLPVSGFDFDVCEIMS